MESFERITPEIAVASHSLTMANVARFEEIINSQVFAEYVDEHRHLDVEGGTRLKDFERPISEAARRLQKECTLPTASNGSDRHPACPCAVAFG